MALAERPSGADIRFVCLQQAFLELKKVLGSDGFTFNIQEEFSTPGSLSVFSKPHGEIRNEFFLEGKIPIVNRYNHSGSRYIDISGRQTDGEGLTFNEFFFASLEFKRRTGRFLGEGNWVKVSGSENLNGRTLLVTIYPDGGLACSYDDGKHEYLEFLSSPVKP